MVPHIPDGLVTPNLRWIVRRNVAIVGTAMNGAAAGVKPLQPLNYAVGQIRIVQAKSFTLWKEHILQTFFTVEHEFLASLLHLTKIRNESS